MTFPIVIQKWTESERGWGQRPDGWSLHLNEKEREKYINKYCDEQPKETPDEYSFPDYEGGKIIDVCESTYEYLKKHKSLRGFDNGSLKQLIGD